MRGKLRLAFTCVSSLLLLGLYLLQVHLQDLGNQYRAGAYMVAWLHGDVPSTPSDTTPGDKVIVMARLKEEPTEWVAQELPEYVPSCRLGSYS